MKRGWWSLLLIGILAFPFAVVQTAQTTQRRLAQERYLQETCKAQGWELERLAAPLHPANAVTRLGKQFLSGLPAAFRIPPEQVPRFLATLHRRVFPASLPLEIMVFQRGTDFRPLLHAGPALGMASFAAKLTWMADNLINRPGKHNLLQREVVASLTTVFPQPVYEKTLPPDEPIRFLGRSPDGLFMLFIGQNPRLEGFERQEFLVFLLARLSNLPADFFPAYHLHAQNLRRIGVFFRDRWGGPGLGSSWFRRRPRLRTFLATSPRLAGDNFSAGVFGPWLVQSLPSTSRSRFRPFLVRRLPEPLFPRGPGASPWWFFLSTNSLGVGILLILQRIWMERGPRLRVALGTVGIFLAGAIIPLSGSLFLGQHLLETAREHALRARERQLHDHLDRLDAGILPFQGQFVTQLKHFRFLDEQGKPAQPPSSPASWPEFFQSHLRRAGLPIKALEAILIQDRKGVAVNVFQDHFFKQFRLIEKPDPLQKRLMESMRQHWRLIAPDTHEANRAQTSASLQDLSSDLVDETLTYLFGPETLASILGFSARRTSFSNFFEAFSLLRTLVRNDGIPAYLITWTWSSRYLDSPYIRQAIDASGTARPAFPTCVSLGREFEVVRSPDMAAAPLSFQALDNLRLEAERSRRAYRQHDLTATDAPLLEALPGRHMKAVLAAQASTADLAQQQAAMQRQLMALGAAVLLVVLVAGLAAGTFFLEPLGRVLAAIDKINRQEYEVTLDADRPDEFGRLGAAFNAMTRGLREGTIIRRFVSASVRQLVRQDRQDRQACLTEATVLFSSFLGFEEFQRHHDPEMVFFLLHRHLEAAATATAQFGGEIDKMVGDKMMIVFRHAEWSKPWSPAEAAVQVAQALRRQVAAAGCPLALAIGINAGTVVAGAMGASDVRLDLTVIGDPINLAARLATLAHTTSGTRIVLSGQVRERLPPALRCRRLPFRSVRGKTQAVDAWLLEESSQ